MLIFLALKGMLYRAYKFSILDKQVQKMKKAASAMQQHCTQKHKHADVSPETLLSWVFDVNVLHFCIHVHKLQINSLWRDAPKSGQER